MTLSTFSCSWKFFAKLSSPIRSLLIDTLLLLLIESLKFCIILLIMFALVYLIFYLLNASNGDFKSAVNDQKSQQLSAGLIENGSFSKFPYVVELPPKASAESGKKFK